MSDELTMPTIRFTFPGGGVSIKAQREGESGDYYVCIRAQASGFKGHSDGHVLGAAFDDFIDDIRRLESTRRGSATFSSVHPGLFSIEVRSKSLLGHMEVVGTLSFTSYPSETTHQQKLEFGFEFDPGQLAGVRCR